MTVAVYVPGKFLVADKRGTGGYQGLAHDIKKIHTVTDISDNEIHLVLAGIAMMPAFVEVLIKKHFVSSEAKKKDLSERLYLFKEEINPYVGDNWEGIIVFVEYGTNISLETKTGYTVLSKRHKSTVDGYRMNAKQVEHLDGFCSIGSGGYLAEGIYLKDNDTLPEDYCYLVSKREVTCGPESDIVTF